MTNSFTAKKVADSTIETIKKVSKTRNSNQTEALNIIASFYDMLGGDWSQDDINSIEEAFNLAPESFKTAAKRSVLKTAKKITEITRTDRDIDITVLNSRIASDARADSFLTMVFDENDKSTEWYDRIYITQTSFKNEVRRKKESGDIEYIFSDAVVKRCLERNRHEIAKHNEKHDMDTTHNFNAYREKRRLEK